ncbi:hypothetical protein CHS0354_026168 [Potamilus streckersoni]|uniref:Uncharacterized protein n=1 Tax=Potamilus streckersoni TaxID=2493646 RepID=A0AAE0SBM8_9BIVA|nr:hypothetical protein CHS0354_026168 [Potamilus streckersoni]
MKVGIKLIALLLYLILATKAAPTDNGKAGGGKNEGDEAGEPEGGGMAGEQGAVKEEGLASEGGEGEEGENAVTVKLPTAIDKSQTPTVVAYEKPEPTRFVTEAATTKQRAGISGSVVPDVPTYTQDMSTMPLVTPDDFSYLDKNGDGFLDYRELFLGQNNFNPVYLNAAFQISDKNFDGVVDQREFFRHPLSWGRVIAEKQFFAKDISTSEAGATENVTSQPDVTPTAEQTYTDQTYTASPAATSPQLPDDNVTTTNPSAEQSTIGLTDVDHQPSVPTDTSTTARVSVVDKVNGGPSVAPAKWTTGQTKTLPKLPQGKMDGASQKTESQVGSKAGATTRSMIGQPAGDKTGDRSVGTGVMLNGGQPTVRKGGAETGSTGRQAVMATGPKDQKRTGAGSFGGQPSGVPGSVGGYGQRSQDGQKNGHAGHTGTMDRHADTVAAKSKGHSGTYKNGVQSGFSVHTGEKIRDHTVAANHPQITQVTWHGKAHVKPPYHPWEMGGSFYGKSEGNGGVAKWPGMDKKYWPEKEKVGTKAVQQSEEEGDEESSNEAEDKKSKKKNGKWNDNKESEDTEDHDENDKK